MPKTRQELTEIMQFRVSSDDKRLIEQASDGDQTSVAEFLRRAARGNVEEQAVGPRCTALAMRLGTHREKQNGALATQAALQLRRASPSSAK